MSDPSPVIVVLEAPDYTDCCTDPADVPYHASKMTSPVKVSFWYRQQQYGEHGGYVLKETRHWP